MFFSNTHWPQLTAPFYSILFETSICQFNSSKLSPLSLIEVQRTPDKRSETIPSSRISPDPSDSQLHDGASSLQFTSLIFYRLRSEDWNGHSRSLVLCSVTHFLCCFWSLFWIIVRLEDPNMAHYKISNRVSHFLIFYLLVFDRIHDAMYLKKMSRTSSRNIGPTTLKIQQYISLYTWGTFLSLCATKPIWVFAAKKLIFWVSSDHRSQSHLKFQSCLTNWICWRLFWMSEENFSWNPPKQHVVM